MRKFYSLFIAILITIIGFGQAPQKMSYQAVIRNNSDQLVTNHAVGIRISILKDVTPVYVETQNPTTNVNGLISIEIGGGTPVTGTFAGIDWSSGTYFIKTETDPAGATNYTITGTSQLLSVPYALYAKASGTSPELESLKDFIYSKFPPPANGLVAYYPFNGNANDESGNGYNGTVTGAALVSNRFGNSNSAYHFNGLHFITTTFTGVLGSADRTISFWAKIGALELGGGGCSYGGGFGTSFNPSVHSTNNAHLDISNSTVSYTASKVNDDIWHNYVYIFSTQYGTSLNGVKVYQDGVLLTVILSTYNYGIYNINTSASPFKIGGGSFDIAMSMDDVRVYNRVLTDDEIVQLYHEGGW